MSENYIAKAQEDAADFIQNFRQDILGYLVDDGEAPTDYSRYSDSYFHESYVDNSWDTSEAIEILEDLHEHEETDHGLWEGLRDWRLELSARAAYTYGNAVSHFITEALQRMNDEVGDVISNFENELEALPPDEQPADDQERERWLRERLDEEAIGSVLSDYA